MNHVKVSHWAPKVPQSALGWYLLCSSQRRQLAVKTFKKKLKQRLIHLLHLGLLRTLILRNVLFGDGSVIGVIDAQAQLDHPVDALRISRGVVQAEPRGQQGGVEQQPHQILHCLVGLVL
eukprot:EG_transcript_53086